MQHSYERTEPVHHRVGGWLPKDQRVLEAWLAKKIGIVEERHRKPTELIPVIEEFQKVIEGDAEIFMAFHEMFEQVPRKAPYNNDPAVKPQVHDYITLLRLFDLMIQEAPEFGNEDLVGFPINAILDWPMGTPAGFRAFTNPKVNRMFDEMFKAWAVYLESTASCSVLNDSETGWFGPSAQDAMPNFKDTFVCDPEAKYHGFTSWDDFFTRRFRPDARPIASPDDNSIVNSACESTVYKIAYKIKKRDHFWIKEEPYSLFHILNNDPLSEQFVGGSIWQAFLGALDYHRWASPVNGVIKKVVNVSGTYYAESPAIGIIDTDDTNPTGLNISQSFITSVAARTLVFIQADNARIGLMCFVAVGMADVSTCEATVKDGDTVMKGDQLGMFHYGGSTHCLIFRPETKITFSVDFPLNSAVPLNAAIATVAD